MCEYSFVIMKLKNKLLASVIEMSISISSEAAVIFLQKKNNLRCGFLDHEIVLSRHRVINSRKWAVRKYSRMVSFLNLNNKTV